MTRPLLDDYNARATTAMRLLGSDYQEPADRARAVAAVSGKPISAKLAKELRRQNPEASSAESIQQLAEGKALAVISGQQTGLFLGPLLTFYKAASAIVSARYLEQETGIACVPIFWLQSEDHDFEEIRRTNFIAADESQQSLELPEATKGHDRVSVSYHLLGKDVSELVSSLKTYLGALPHAAQFVQMVEAAYLPGRSVVDAFSALLGTIFADDGLLVFSPKTAVVSKLTAPIYERALSDCESISQLLLQQASQLESNSYPVQVHIRERSPLFFVHEGSAAGPRHRVELRDEQWHLVGQTPPKSISKAQLAEIATNHPEQLSSSALLRPLIQDFLFPTAAYVGGPAELNYSAQLSPLYKHFGISKPLFIPRAQFTLLEQRHERLLGKMGLSAKDIYLPEEALRQRIYGSDATSQNDPFAAAKGSIEDTFSKLRAAMTRVDSTLESSANKAEAKVSHQLESLERRYREAIAREDHITQERLSRLQTALFPEGQPQERFYSLASFWALYGPSFKDKILSSIAPLAPTNRELLL